MQIHSKLVCLSLQNSNPKVLFFKFSFYSDMFTNEFDSGK